MSARSHKRGSPNKKGTFMFINTDACFEHKKKEPPLHPSIIKQARSSGQLNLSNRGLIEVPDVVWNLNSLAPEEVQTLSLSMDSADEERWWDQVDLTKLILASNSLTVISPAIQNHRSLTVLDLHDNKLTSLPDSIEELRLLSKLNMSHNKFEQIPQGVFQLKELKQLSAHHNQIAELNDDIGNLSLLDELDLSHNLLKELPHTMGFLSRATVFNLANNELITLPPEVGDMAALKRLEVTHNNLKSLPEELGNLNRMEQFYCQHNNINALPLFYHCDSLKELHAGNNYISEVSSELLETILQIKILDLRDNKISVIPDEIIWLQALERLDLTNNNLSTLPYTLGTLPHLKSLCLDGNPFRSVRRDIIQRGTVQLLKWLRSRIEDPSKYGSPRSRPPSEDMECRTDGFSPVIDKYMLRSSRTLNYSNKGLTNIPKDVIAMAQEAEVNTIDLSKNSFTTVPISLNELSAKMSELNLSFNRLSQLPAFLGSCNHLAYMDLRNNQLTDLPSEFSGLNSLREINLSFNKLHHLPSVLHKLSRLEIIFASDNSIQDIDVAGLSQIASLATLDLRNNDIHQVPPELGNVQQLRSLQLEGNPFRNPRPAILAKGTGPLLEYLRGRIPS